jgi:hypothetical protein
MTLCLLVQVVALSLAAEPDSAPAGELSVLVLPIEAKDGVSKSEAELATAAFAAEADRVPGFRVITYREVEGTMTQEQVRQVVGCDAVACAAEIAGAMNTDQIVLGQVGKFGEAEVVLTMTRVEARSARVLGRVVERYDARHPRILLDRLPWVVATVLGTPPPPGPPPEVPPPSPPESAPVLVPASQPELTAPVPVRKPWEDLSGRPAAPGAVVGGVTGCLVTVLLDAAGSVIALVPVVGCLGLAMGCTGVFCAGPGTAWFLGTKLAAKRVALLKVAALAALPQLIMLVPRLALLAATVGVGAVLGLKGLELLAGLNLVVMGSTRNPDFWLPLAGYGLAVAGWGVLGCVGACGSGLASSVALLLLGRGKGYWESGTNLDLVVEEDPRGSWLEFKTDEERIRKMLQ